MESFNQKIIEFIYKNSPLLLFPVCLLYWYLRYFSSMTENVKTVIFIGFILFLFLIYFLIRRNLLKVYAGTVRVYLPENDSPKSISKFIFYFIIAMLVVYGYYFAMRQVSKDYMVLVVLLHIPFGIWALIYELNTWFGESGNNANYFKRIILTRTQLIVYRTKNRINKFSLCELVFEKYGQNELLLKNTSNNESILVDITSLLDSDKQELMESLSKHVN